MTIVLSISDSPLPLICSLHLHHSLDPHFFTHATLFYRTQVHPSKRLPLIYLMDSILKNVKSVYISLFSKYVERLFVETYTESGDTIRGKLMRLLGTWRSCNLFPEPLLNALHSASVTAQSSAPTHSIRVLGSAVASGRHGRDRRSDRDKERERSRRQRTSQPYPQPHPNPLSQRSQQPYPNAPQPKRARTSYHGDGRAGSASAGALPSMTDVLRLLKKELVNRPDLQPMLDNIERNMKNKTGNMKEAIEALRRALQSPPSSNTTLQNSNPAPQPSQAPAHAHAPVSSTPSMSSSSSSSASAASAAPFAGVDFSALSQSLSSLNSILAPAPSPVHTITAPVPGVNSNSNRRSGGRAPVRSARVFDFDSKSLKMYVLSFSRHCIRLSFSMHSLPVSLLPPSLSVCRAHAYLRVCPVPV